MDIVRKLHKARVDGEPFELHDIFDDISSATARQVVADNVEYTLKREKLLPRGYSVLVPMGGVVAWHDESPRGGIGSVHCDFEIFAPDMNTIVAYGTAYGNHMAGELVDLTTEITEVTGETGKPRKRTAPKSRKPAKGGPSSVRGLRR